MAPRWRLELKMLPDVIDQMTFGESNQASLDHTSDRIAETAAELRHDLIDAIMAGGDKPIHNPYPNQWKSGWTVSDEVADALADERGHRMHACIARLVALVANGDTLLPSDRIAAQAVVKHIVGGYEAKCIDALENRE